MFIGGFGCLFCLDLSAPQEIMLMVLQLLLKGLDQQAELQKGYLFCLGPVHHYDLLIIVIYDFNRYDQTHTHTHTHTKKEFNFVSLSTHTVVDIVVVYLVILTAFNDCDREMRAS